MIEQSESIHGYTLSCDGCSYVEEFEEVPSWDRLMVMIHESPWRTSRFRGKWRHTCRACVERMEREVMEELEND